ncbi:FHA domain-containing protein [Candidatus Woesearchaeota archaeon]|nr:FHA domain-containing protein [Candidatus Woesearchaeota archaeon]
MTWLIRPVAIGDIDKNVVELERRVIPAANLLIGTLAKYHKKLEEWDYHTACCNDYLSSDLQKRNLELHVESIFSLNPEKFRHISRFHVFLEEKNNELYITDLGSKNGTYIEGKKIKKAKLEDEQIFHLGGKKEDSARFKVYKQIEQIYALLVGVDNKEKRSADIDKIISRFDEWLKKLNTPCSKKIIKHEAVTLDELRFSLYEAEQLSENSLFFFYYAAHGNNKVLTTIEQTVCKTEITEYLNKIKAKKLVIIDSCYAAAGWENLDLQSGLYLFSAEEELYGWNSFSHAFSVAIELLLSKPYDFKNIDMDVLGRSMAMPNTCARKGEKSIFIC